MLTGVLPFSAADPMEWVHCHIAREPVAPTVRCASVPAPISNIVMKLLAKTAEQRYQTAAGLEHDLRRCLSQWEEKKHIDVFGRRTRYVGAAVDSREALRARARGREVTRGVRPRCRGQWAGTGSGRRPGRHWEVFGGRRTASRTRAVAWSFRVRQVRPTQARCPLRQCSASATGADQTAVRKKRRRVGALASCTQHGARSKRCPDGDARPGARAPHRCATANSGSPAERRAAAVSLRTTSSARRIRATRTSTGTVPGRPAMARCSYARPARGSAE